VQSLQYSRHYLLPAEFVLYSDHQALHYINSQKRVRYQHIKWFEFIQYTFVLKHRLVWMTKLSMLWVRDLARYIHLVQRWLVLNVLCKIILLVRAWWNLYFI